MTETADNIVIEQLRLLRNELAAFRTETREHFHTLDSRMSAQEKHMAALIAQLPPVWEEIAGIRRRIERIEARLELSD